jgi:DNA repair exonuclease SbcCD ATPase subunit
MDSTTNTTDSQAGGSDWELSEAIRLMGEAQASGDAALIATAMRRHAEALINVTNTTMIPTLKNVLETVVKREVTQLSGVIDGTTKVQDQRFQYMLNQLSSFLDKEDARHDHANDEMNRITEALVGLRSDGQALQAEFRAGLSGIQQTVSMLVETVDDLQEKMRESQEDRRVIHEEIASVRADIVELRGPELAPEQRQRYITILLKLIAEWEAAHPDE